jgi:hypothetical protein
MSESSQLPLLDALRRVTVRPRERREMAPFKALPRARHDLGFRGVAGESLA